jgi:hypothetical protein
MAYNNYYPAGYQPMYYPQAQQMQNNQMTQQQNTNGMIWVVGENGADSYLVAPNQTVLLWDSTAPVIYLKSADNLGRPSKRILDYKERGALAQEGTGLAVSDFATKEDVSLIREEIDSLRAKFEDMKGAKK